MFLPFIVICFHLVREFQVKLKQYKLFKNIKIYRHCFVSKQERLFVIKNECQYFDRKMSCQATNGIQPIQTIACIQPIQTIA